MNKMLSILFAYGGSILAVCVGALSFGDSFVTGLVLILVVFVFAIAWPMTLAVGLSARFRKARLIRSLAGADRWTQDAVLAELDSETRTECWRRLGRQERVKP